MAACCNPAAPPPRNASATSVARTSLTPEADGAAGFGDAQGLRAVLTRLAAAGNDGWRDDPQAAALMRFAADRYASLARKHRQDPGDAAAAAFEAMRNPSTRLAEDPWAVVTVAVRVTLIAEERAEGMLTSCHRARRSAYLPFHDAQRLGDRDLDVADQPPAVSRELGAAGREEPPVVMQAAQLLELLGWEAQVADRLVGYVCQRLADIGERRRAYEILRRDKAMRAALDLPQDDWTGLLRTLLGHPGEGGRQRHGALARLLLGDSVADLLGDDDLVRTAVPHQPVEVPAGVSR